MWFLFIFRPDEISVITDGRAEIKTPPLLLSRQQLLVVSDLPTSRLTLSLLILILIIATLMILSILRFLQRHLKQIQLHPFLALFQITSRFGIN